MDNWDCINRTSPFGVKPEPPYVPFLRRWRGEEGVTKILEIGPGRSLRHYLPAAFLGFDIISVDISNAVAANYHGDVRDINCSPNTFDLVTDIKSICQDPDPPYAKIYEWIKPGGYLFCIMPTDDHLTHPEAYPIRGPEGGEYQYEYMRMATLDEVRALFPMFSLVKIYKYETELMNGQYKLFNWCIEARK